MFMESDEFNTLMVEFEDDLAGILENLFLAQKGKLASAEEEKAAVIAGQAKLAAYEKLLEHERFNDLRRQQTKELFDERFEDLRKYLKKMRERA